MSALAKKWYTSRTIIASFVAVVATVLKLFGVINLDEPLQQIVVDIILSATQLIAPLVAVWGRVVAQVQINRAGNTSTVGLL